MGTFSGAIIIFAAAYLEVSGVDVAPVMFLLIGLAVIGLVPDNPLIKIEISNNVKQASESDFRGVTE